MGLLSKINDWRSRERALNEAIEEDPWLQEQTFESFVELSMEYPEAREGYIKCGVCGDDISLPDIFGWKFEADRDHPLYYVCEGCASEGRIERVRVKGSDGVWFPINLVE